MNISYYDSTGISDDRVTLTLDPLQMSQLAACLSFSSRGLELFSDVLPYEQYRNEAADLATTASEILDLLLKTTEMTIRLDEPC